MIVLRNIIYLGFIFFGLLLLLAAIFVVCGAEFIGLAQIVVYVGGILVLLLFGVMLASRNSPLMPQTGVLQLLPGGFTALGVVSLMVIFIYRLPTFDKKQNTLIPSELTTTEWIGKMLLTNFLIPFEIASFLLLIALIGATFIIRKHKSEI